MNLKRELANKEKSRSTSGTFCLRAFANARSRYVLPEKGRTLELTTHIVKSLRDPLRLCEK